MRASALAAVLCFAACNQTEPPARLGDTPAARPGDDERPSSGRSPAEVRRSGNHLVDQPSPYLLQHAHNPVDWYPWGEEALAAARDQDKPIFLSIGYSTCHWCHVMEEESFENDAVAAYLNEHFISIKVDREQRPDIDALYIEAVRQLGGSTGWPLTVFLTPDLVPFFGGTYFPREGSGGRPGFTDLIREIAQRYRDEGREQVATRGRVVFRQIEASARRLGGVGQPVGANVIDSAMARLSGSRDPQLGGFGRRQKFPNAPLLLAELRYVERTGDAAARSHLINTLQQMSRGGIRDHLAGSFHRYAVDRTWHVPHFEKTLYDNAQLAQVYVEAGRVMNRPDFTQVGREVLDDLIEHWQRDDGGLVVGFDADDPEGEGYYYTWTPSELEATLGEVEAARFGVLYGVTDQGERLLEGRSVLHRLDDARMMQTLSLNGSDAYSVLRSARGPLLAVRDRREPPATDDKELASWNGLALMSLAVVGRWLDEPRYLAAAQRVARFLLERCWDEERGIMLRGRRRGESLGEGFLDDYTIPILGLLRLHAADGDARWLLAAHRIARVVRERFYDASLNTFLHTARSDVPEGLPLRRPDLDDGVLPSGGNAATLAFLELGAMAGDREVYDIGERSARAASSRASQNPFGAGFLLVTLDHLVGQSREVVLAGADTDALFEVIRDSSEARVLPIRVGAGGATGELAERYPALRNKTAIDGRATAYVCEIGRCELPTSTPGGLRAQLAALAGP